MTPEIIVVGGGLAGSLAAWKLAERGRSVLVLELEKMFRDRVRGEQMHPWGGAAARRLGIYDELMQFAHDARYFTLYSGGAQIARRDLRATTPWGLGSIHFSHPEMQEHFLRGASKAGAEVVRGARVETISPGEKPSVTFARDGERTTISSSIVLGADGRTSKARAWSNFEVKRDPEKLRIAGMLFENAGVPDDSVHKFLSADAQLLMLPYRNNRARIYFMYDQTYGGRRKLSGKERMGEYLRQCQATGAPADWFEGLGLDAPLADFDGASQWVAHPARGGVALIGDAAASLDPCFGNGMSKTLRDVEAVVEALSAHANDRERALDAYAKRHDEHFTAVHDIESWLTRLNWSRGPEAQARRERVARLMRQGHPGLPDIALGPEGPHDDAARKLLLGEG